MLKLFEPPQNSLAHASISRPSFKSDALPLLSRDFERVREVGMSEIAVASASSRYSCLATCGLGPCIGVAGFDRSSRIGFVAHLGDGNSLQAEIGAVIYHARRLSGAPNLTFETVILGGFDGFSEMLLRDVENAMRINFGAGIRFTVIGRDVLGSSSEGRSIALDVTSGELSQYVLSLI